ncbi:FAD binding domain-containing protein [Pseudonocardia bannensis]|uniref:Xanthine dehydrogenase family protein subunit M n=1 Tax=Pseudonocardia bannensis TaxID=630973 RepID=A0A848DT82_9PSEU|nr:xanthine dehydrogenase family protein subunit M [Pseudonocardia bannensis]NMH95581.1 xanthine dehydrogenase family protein subunit M [Pseudonocardia bannensis]
MKPAPFAYAKPESVDEALAILAEHGDEAKVLGGGQSLLPLLNMRLARPSVLVDLGGIAELAGITSNGSISIGAMTRQVEVEQSAEIASALPILPAALSHVGHAAIRTRGTFGGSIAHADPAAELPTVFSALEGEAVIAGQSGSRTVGADDFFTTYFTTSVGDDELLKEVRLRRLTPADRWAFLEVARRHGDFALVGVAVVLTTDGDGPDAVCSKARIALSGVADVPVRAKAAEAVLEGARLSEQDVIAEAAAVAASAFNPEGDVHASAEYRKEVAQTLVRRAVAQAIETGARS